MFLGYANLISCLTDPPISPKSLLRKINFAILAVFYYYTSYRQKIYKDFIFHWVKFIPNICYFFIFKAILVYFVLLFYSPLRAKILKTNLFFHSGRPYGFFLVKNFCQTCYYIGKALSLFEMKQKHIILISRHIYVSCFYGKNLNFYNRIRPKCSEAR